MLNILKYAVVNAVVGTRMTVSWPISKPECPWPSVSAKWRTVLAVTSRDEKRAARFRTGQAKKRQRTLAAPKDVAADEGRSKGPINAECKH